MDDEFTKDDKALDFIIYEEITNDTGDQAPSPGKGCLSVLLLPVLLVTGLHLMMI